MNPHSLVGIRIHKKPAASEQASCLEDIKATFGVTTTNSPSGEASLNFLQPLGLRFQEHMATELQKDNFLVS